jgi:hypothetical protein
MSNTLIATQGHSFLPLSVRITKDNLVPDRYYVTTRISESVAHEDFMCRTESRAREQANICFEVWTERLMPVFNAGCALAQAERVR